MDEVLVFGLAGGEVCVAAIEPDGVTGWSFTLGLLERRKDELATVEVFYTRPPEAVEIRKPVKGRQSLFVRQSCALLAGYRVVLSQVTQDHSCSRTSIWSLLVDAC